MMKNSKIIIINIITMIIIMVTDSCGQTKALIQDPQITHIIKSNQITLKNNIFFNRQTKNKLEGIYVINEVDTSGIKMESDVIIKLPLLYTGSTYKGVFRSGLKEGTWFHYIDDETIKIERYKEGNLLSTQICPCNDK